MRVFRWMLALGAGLVAGLVGVLLMTLLFAAGRNWLGISPPPEAIPDRFAPTLDIDTFFSLFSRYGGYNGLKRFGIRSGLMGLFAVGAGVGIIYAVVVERARGRTTETWKNGLSRTGLIFVAVAAFVLWIATMIVLAPVLDANYRGLPPSWALPVTAIGLLVAYASYGLAVILTYRWLVPPAAAGEIAPVPHAPTLGRRAVVAGIAGAALAVPSYWLIQRLNNRATFSYDGTPYSGPGVEPITPTNQFYSVTKNVVDPNVTTTAWRLEVGGLVDNPQRYSFDDLVAMPATDQETTLMCISNTIGAGLFSNASWRGVPMRDLLEAAGPHDGAVEVLLHAADGYTDTFAFDKAMDPTTMVVYEMNGEPLPERHGYPARVVVPGLYGEKNVKWVTKIEVVDHDAKGFYEQQGWGPNFEIPTRSDIFGPRWTRRDGDRFVEPFRVNAISQIRGRAFAGNRGVSKVEYSVDEGETWLEARIDYPGTQLTWTFWSFDWGPTEPGEYQIVSRATDGTGELQTTERRGIVPQGATGYHRVIAVVETA